MSQKSMVEPVEKLRFGVVSENVPETDTDEYSHCI